jgi:hypothetical protein
MTIPGTSAAGVLLGVYNDNGRERMVLTGAMNENQTQQQLLFNGILNWLTYGVHLGTERNYFSVHIDDVFLPDARWSAANNCTVGDDCAASVNEPDIIMTAADVDFLVQWQNANGVKLDMVYNGGGYNDAVAAGPFPLGDRLLAVRSSLRWVNHTLDHLYLGCIQDFSVVPWRCATNSSGAILWTTYQDLFNQIRVNQQFSTSKGLGIVSSELVTGEHSGLRRAPQEPSDNPNLARALRDAGITWVASDNSREALPRKIGSTTTSPRYPMNIYYNTGKKTEAVDEYNWVYNAAGQGGSGVCETNAASTCIAPLDVNQDFDRYIVPQEARAMLLHMLSNSPRSHYAHQSNLAEDRILYPVLDKALASYKGAFSTQTPVVNASLTELGTELQRQVNWGAGRARISAYIQAGALNVTLGSGTTSTLAPVTVPSAATGGTLASYAGYRTGWNTVSTTTRPKYTLPSSVAYAR